MEIGSEFWDIPLCNKGNEIFPSNTEWFISGRSALKAIIKDIKSRITLKSVALPSWCCDSMIIPFLKEGVEVKFYPVCFEDNMLKQSLADVGDCDALLLMDYFGYKRQTDFNFNGIIIQDVTHSIFYQKNFEADYTFGSLRKWAGFYTGGFAFKRHGRFDVVLKNTNFEYINLRKSAMDKKSRFINGEIDNKDFLEDFFLAEEMLEQVEITAASQEDISRTDKLDIDFIKQKRRHNAQVLLNELSTLAIFPDLREEDCPLFVPLLVPDNLRDKLRKYLIDKKIYCPVHWPVSEFHRLNSKTQKLYEQEISIVCDQRYGEEDMKRICSEIKCFLELR